MEYRRRIDADRGPEQDLTSDVIRIGDKVIQRSRIIRVVDRILERRAEGLSQQDVAAELGVDRTFVSRLESLGEVRRGAKIALIGFPIANREELEQLARDRGVDFVLLLSERERWKFVEDTDGATLFNRLLHIIARIKACDVVIFLGSDMRVKLLEQVLGAQRLLAVELGPSPLQQDCHVDVDQVAQLIEAVREA